MKGGVQAQKVMPSRAKPIILTLLAVLVIVFVLLPLLFMVLGNQTPFGNVAVIPIHGVLTVDGSSSFGQETISSTTIIEFIKEADENNQIKVILLEINSPGGSAVASDEIASAIKQSPKPVVALIREVGASGGYWVASAADRVIANRMSITGSIGVISSYLEFSGLMEKYGIEYEQLTAGERKDIGTPYRKLTDQEHELLVRKLDKIHEFFIQEIAANRNMDIENVRKIATGEFYLGSEAFSLGLVDSLGDAATAEEYIKQAYNLENIDYARYEQNPSFFDLLGTVASQFSFHIGKGIASSFMQQQPRLMLT